MKKKFTGMLVLASTLALAACSNNTNSETIATTKYGNVTREEFVNAMKETVGEQTLQRLVLTKVLEGSVFTDEDIKKYYDEWEPQIKVQHILIAAKSTASDEEKAAAKAKAEELIKKLKDGADFSELAKENSADTGTASKGGEIGPFKRSDMVTEFSTAAYDLKNVGDITETPVQTQFGYHIIKLVSKEEKKPFDEMKEQMEKEMLDAKLKDSAYLHQTMVDLVKAADVKITDESLQNALKNFLKAADSETTTTAAK